MSQNLIYYLFLSLFSFNIVASLLRNLHFLQLKEYRFDRYSTFLRYEQGLKKVFNPISILGNLIAIISFLIGHKLLFGVALLLLMSSNLYIILTKGIYRPVRTTKSSLIFLITIGLLTLSILSNPTITKLNLTLLLSVPLLFIVTMAFYPLTKISKEFYVRKAAHKIKQYPNLKIVGVTGSYGKSSTKEFLYQILKDHYHTYKTPKNINTEIGVARFILKENLSSAQILVVEMGAYQVGEIKKICQISPPDISILTAIHNQHLSLYGTQENIAKTKLEIINYAKPNATFIYNENTPGSHYISKLKDPLPENTISISNETNLTNIDQSENNLNFTYNKKSYSTPIIGPHFAENISMAIEAALQLGLTQKQINSSLQNLHLPENTFSIKKGIKKSIILDDSYNSSPQGFQAAINTSHIISHTGRKILVTMGMVELGPDEEKEHLKIAQFLKSKFDLIITTSFTTHKYFQTQIQDEKLKYLPDVDHLIEILETEMTKNDLILLENRVSPKLKKFLKLKS